MWLGHADLAAGRMHQWTSDLRLYSSRCLIYRQVYFHQLLAARRSCLLIFWYVCVMRLYCSALLSVVNQLMYDSGPGQLCLEVASAVQERVHGRCALRASVSHMCALPCSPISSISISIHPQHA